MFLKLFDFLHREFLQCTRDVDLLEDFVLDLLLSRGGRITDLAEQVGKAFVLMLYGNIGDKIEGLLGVQHFEASLLEEVVDV